MENTLNKIADIYLSYRNDFLTVEGFASYYGITIETAKYILRAGMSLQELRANGELLDK